MKTKNHDVRNGILGALLTIGICYALTGCSTAGKRQIDLGDGQIFDLVPVSAAAKGLNLYKPGAGDALLKIEDVLAKRRSVTNAVFAGLPTTQDYVILLREPVEGLSITPAQIATIRRTTAAVVPEPIVEEVSIDTLWGSAAHPATASNWKSILSNLEGIRSNIQNGVSADVEAR